MSLEFGDLKLVEPLDIRTCRADLDPSERATAICTCPTPDRVRPDWLPLMVAFEYVGVQFFAVAADAAVCEVRVVRRFAVELSGLIAVRQVDDDSSLGGRGREDARPNL